MYLSRVGLALVLMLGVCGCEVGGPKRASDIQNLNAINDDISAVTMTESQTRRARDPNTVTPIPRTYQVIRDEP